MKTAENEKYLIIDTENRYYLYPFYIFDKISGDVIITNKAENESFFYNPTDKIEKEIGLISIKGGLI